jgi:adenine-specific DNA glycosylase
VLKIKMILKKKKRTKKKKKNKFILKKKKKKKKKKKRKFLKVWGTMWNMYQLTHKQYTNLFVLAM